MKTRDWLAEDAYRKLWDEHRNSVDLDEMYRLERQMEKLQSSIEKCGEAFFQVFLNNLPGYKEWRNAIEAVRNRKINQ